MGWIDNCERDLRLALRVIRKESGRRRGCGLFAGAGIGSNIGIFSLMDAALSAPASGRRSGAIGEIRWLLQLSDVPRTARRKYRFVWTSRAANHPSEPGRILPAGARHGRAKAYMPT